MSVQQERYEILAWPLGCLAICLCGLDLFKTGNGSYLALGAAVSALLTLWLSLRNWKQRPQPTALIGLLVLHGTVMLTIWLLIPVSEKASILAPMLLLVVATAVWLARSVNPLPPASLYFDARHAPVDLAILLLPVLMAADMDGGAQARSLAQDYPTTLLTYLVYAWIQLFLFLDLPLRVLRLNGIAAGPASMVCGAVFALLHLPNPLLMAFTGTVMWIFSWQYQKGRSLLVLVVLMAVTATTLKIAVPEQVTGELRIGPDYLDHAVAR